jgi:hypothetical protein
MKLRQAECAHDVGADAGRQECSRKRAEKKNSDHGSQRGPRCRIDGAEQHDPAVCHQGAIENDERDGEGDPPEIGMNERIEDGTGPRAPKYVRRDRDDKKNSEEPPDWARRQLRRRKE